jgi:DNA-directed RNA polymerase specialized sigma24 family protein
MEYQLTITPPGQPTEHRNVTGTTPTDLAQAVHRHARGLLGGQIDIHLDGLTGTAHRNHAHAADLTLTPTPPAPETPGPAHGDGIRGGWTLTDLDRLAKTVVSNNRTWWPAGDRNDQYTAAWHGIVEHLYTADEPPARRDLLEAGRNALADDVRDTMRHRGMRRDTSNNGARYAMYWDWAGRATPGPESGIVERAALDQILSALTARQREAFAALAAAGDYPEAARVLGIADQTFRSLLGRARGAFRELWHEGEEPSAHWGCDRRAGSVRGTVGKGDSAVTNLRRRQRAARKKAAA